MNEETVARLTARVTSPHRVVLISGKQGSGKSTLADGLAAAARAAGWAVHRTRFARVLYEIHDAARSIARQYGVPWPEKYGAFLQMLGTELGRKDFGEDVWVRACVADVDRALDAATRPTVVLIDDMRFPNEFDAFADCNHPVMRIRLAAEEAERRGRADGWRDATGHASEVGLDAHAAADMFDVYCRTDAHGVSAAQCVAHVAAALRLDQITPAPPAARLSNGMEITNGDAAATQIPRARKQGEGAT